VHICYIFANYSDNNHNNTCYNIVIVYKTVIVSIKAVDKIINNDNQIFIESNRKFFFLSSK
jgi:hypothetical protein